MDSSTHRALVFYHEMVTSFDMGGIMVRSPIWPTLPPLLLSPGEPRRVTSTPVPEAVRLGPDHPFVSHCRDLDRAYMEFIRKNPSRGLADPRLTKGTLEALSAEVRRLLGFPEDFRLEASSRIGLVQMERRLAPRSWRMGSRSFETGSPFLTTEELAVWERILGQPVPTVPVLVGTRRPVESDWWEVAPPRLSASDQPDPSLALYRMGHYVRVREDLAEYLEQEFSDRCALLPGPGPFPELLRVPSA